MKLRRSVLACLCLWGCSDDAAAGPSTSSGDDDAKVEVSEKDASVRDAKAPPAMRDAGKLDAGTARIAQCAPGHYEGKFDCAIAGLLPWTGRMAFDLVENSTGSGEFQTLSIAAGTEIVGDQDSMGGMFTGELQADFDCQTGELDGQLANGRYLFVGAMEYMFEGPLHGLYRSDGGTPGFDGTLGTLTTPNFEFAGPFAPTGDCTWSADLTDSAPDAGP